MNKWKRFKPEMLWETCAPEESTEWLLEDDSLQV